MIEKITGFLADNALTRSWGDSVGRGVNYLERQVVDDEALRHAVGTRLSQMTQGAAVTDPQLEVLQRLKGGEIDRQLFDEYMRTSEEGPAGYVGGVAAGYAEDSGMGRDALKSELAALQSPVSQITNAGNAANVLLGNPVMAYSAVGAGGAMGTAAAIEAYDWWQSQQQQAEKDRQLPLVQG